MKMDIRVSGVYDAYKVYNTNGTGKASRVSAAKTDRDDFAISLQAEDYNKVRRALSNVPDIRSAQVEATRARIETGNYQVAPADIAAQIVQAMDEIE